MQLLILKPIQYNKTGQETYQFYGANHARKLFNNNLIQKHTN